MQTCEQAALVGWPLPTCQHWILAPGAGRGMFGAELSSPWAWGGLRVGCGVDQAKEGAQSVEASSTPSYPPTWAWQLYMMMLRLLLAKWLLEIQVGWI